MKSSLAKKIVAYSSAASAVLVASSASATMRTMELEPDSVIEMGNVYELDFNGDDIVDAGIAMASYGGNPWGVVQASGVVGAQYATRNANVYPYAYVLSSGTYVSFGQNWLSNQGNLFFAFTPSGGSSTGPWVGQTSKYIGLTFQVGGQQFFGWVNITVTPNKLSLTINYYGYQDVPGTPAPAGTYTSIENRSERTTSIYSFGRSIKVSGAKGATAEVYNLAGQRISQHSLTSNNASFNVDTKGLHLIKVRSGGKTTTQKVYL